MGSWLTPEIAVLLMFAGVIPSLANVYLLYDYRRQPGVLWFIASMATGGIWAFLYPAFTVASSPAVTLALANFFWAAIPTAAVTMFLLAYEFNFKQTVSRRTVVVLFSPIVVLFVLSWFNPANLVFTPEYHVGSDGFLYFPLVDGPVKTFVTQVYGYLLVFLAAGMFVGEVMRTSGIRRRQSIYLLATFSTLVVSTMIKVAGLVPIYFDPTSVVYSLSGLLFAYSINKNGLLKYVPIAREQTFQEVNDAILVVDPNDVVVDFNRLGRNLFGSQIVGKSIEEVLPDYTVGNADGATQTIQLHDGGNVQHFTLRTSLIDYGRGLTGKIIVLSDISALKEREHELDLLKQILSRVFRHNIRNDLTVINGCAELIKEGADEQTTKLADKILEKSDRLLNQAEKARQIEKTVTRDDVVSRSLWDEVERVVADYRTHDGIVLRSSVEDVTVELHPRFDLAIRELIENAVTHHSADTVPEIDIYTEETEEGITLVVEDDGPGIPRNEIEVLQAEQETDLEHSSGVGLWLVRWIATHSNGELVVEATDSGTRIGILLHRPAAVNEGHT